MKRKNLWQLLLLLSVAVFFTTCKKEVPCDCDEDDPPKVNVSVFATGLNNPRGLEFGPDGYLYVAEGGVGGTNSTVGQCVQVGPPAGPYTGSATGGRISRINASGLRTTLTDNLPSSRDNPMIGGNIVGVADVAFIGHQLYALLGGAGCSHGVPSVPNGIVKVASNGSWTLHANLSDFLLNNPGASDHTDLEPEGVWYSMVPVGNRLFALEPNQGVLDVVNTSGGISRLVDIAATEGHIVPTALTYHGGNFFMGNLGVFPIVPGTASIYKITPSGAVSTWATGFTSILGIAFDKHDRLYVLETTVGAPFPSPGRGQIVRVNPSGERHVITTGLSNPSGMTIGPDNKIYVSNFGFGPAAIGGGQVLKIDVQDCECDCGDEDGDEWFLK